MVASLLCLAQLSAFAAEPSIVASPSAEVRSLSQREARQLFTLRRNVWSNGLPVQLVLPPPNSAEDQWLSQTVLGLPPDVYQRFLAEQAYRRGGAVPPRSDRAGVLEAVTNAGTDAGVVSVISGADDPSIVTIELKSE